MFGSNYWHLTVGVCKFLNIKIHNILLSHHVNQETPSMFISDFHYSTFEVLKLLLVKFIQVIETTTSELL